MVLGNILSAEGAAELSAKEADNADDGHGRHFSTSIGSFRHCTFLSNA